MKANYLKIFKDKKEKEPLLKKVVTDFFSRIKLSKRQKIWGVIALICFFVSFTMKLRAGGSDYLPDTINEGFEKMMGLLAKAGADPTLAATIAPSWSGMDIIKNMLGYLTDIQIKSIDYINDTAFGTSTMFDHIYFGITIFAVIGCVYKLIMHFLKTERFDNVGAFTGFFQFIGIALLFVFSDQIVNQVVSLNQGVNTEVIGELNTKLDNELSNTIIRDLTPVIKKIKDNLRDIEKSEEIKADEYISLGTNWDIFKLSFENVKLAFWDAGLALQFKYMYFSTVIAIIASIMAIPTVIISIMIKILLTVMVAGTKLVFLLAFIPGFENTWKTFMANMLNILLWGPIFTAIYGFVVNFIVFMLAEDSLGTGQIIWLTILACILAFQSLSLTTSAAGVVIQGAGASMAGALGSMSSMSGVNVAMGVTKAAVGVGAVVAGGAMASKFMSKAGSGGSKQ